MPNFSCVQFGLFSEFSVSQDASGQIQALMDLTHTHDPDEGIEDGGHRTALFGSRTRTRGITHQVQGRLTMTPRTDDLRLVLSISSMRSPSDLGPPPKSFRPVSVLVGAASELFGSISVSCHAVFEYDHRQGFRSKVSLPFPLMVLEDIDGITHIESAQFSRRDNDDIEYRILILNREDSDIFVHSVSFDSTLELNINSIRGVIDKARSISTRLIRTEGEGHDARIGN